MATTAKNLGNFLVTHLPGRSLLSGMKAALKMLNVATDGTQEATKFINTDTNTNQGVIKATALHIGATSAETQVNATPAEINQGADMSVRGEALTVTEVVASTDNGKVFFLTNSTTEFVSTLPLLSTIGVGWHCKFLVSQAPSGASYTIIENASDSNKIILKGISETETDDDSDGVESAGCSTITVKDGVAVVGDWVDIYSDGTSWFVTGNSLADGGFEQS